MLGVCWNVATALTAYYDVIVSGAGLCVYYDCCLLSNKAFKLKVFLGQDFSLCLLNSW